eukprot:4181175-Prymnesium_polylepis.1
MCASWCARCSRDTAPSRGGERTGRTLSDTVTYVYQGAYVGSFPRQKQYASRTGRRTRVLLARTRATPPQCSSAVLP